MARVFVHSLIAFCPWKFARIGGGVVTVVDGEVIEKATGVNRAKAFDDSQAFAGRCGSLQEIRGLYD